MMPVSSIPFGILFGICRLPIILSHLSAQVAVKQFAGKALSFFQTATEFSSGILCKSSKLL